MNEQMQENVIKSKGNIFKIFISMYDCVDNNLVKNEDEKLEKEIEEEEKWQNHRMELYRSRISTSFYR